MMLEYMGWNEAAGLITTAMQSCFSKGYVTGDLAGRMTDGKPLTTSRFGEYLIKEMKHLK